MRMLLLVLAVTLAGTGCVAVSPLGVRTPDDALVYQPSKYPDGEWSPPGLDYEDAWFESADGTKLHGWFCPAPDPRAVVLVAHGNAGNLSHRWPWMKLLQQRLRVSAMVFDYRGFGRSEGRPSERGVLADARAARAWLAKRTDVAEDQIVLFGESLGGGVAVDLAANDGAAGLILKSTFTSLPDVAAEHVRYLPVRYMMRNRFDSLAKIGRYEGPLLMAHGDADELIPIEQAERLLEAAPGRTKLLTIPGADHNWAPTEEFIDEIDRFLDQVAGRESTSDPRPNFMDEL